MSLVPGRNVWLIRQQNQGLSPSTTANLKSNQNASTNPTSIVGVADDEAWPQVNVNSSPSKTKEKAREKNVLSPSATTNGIVLNPSPKKGDKGKPKWVPMTLTEASAASLPSNIGSSPSARTSNITSPHLKSPVPLPTTSSVATVADDTFEVNAQVTSDELETEEQGSTSVSITTPPPEPQASPQMSLPHSRSTSPSHNQPVVPQSYPLLLEAPYVYQPHPYPVYDPPSAYLYLPYASSSSAQYPPYPPEPLSYVFSGQMPGPIPIIGQTTGDAMVVTGGATTVFGDVEPSHEKRLPPFGVGCVDRKGKGKRKDVVEGEITNERRRRRRPPFAVSSWRSSSNDEVVDLTSWSDIKGNPESPDSGPRELKDYPQERTKRKWLFFWDGSHFVNVSCYLSFRIPVQQDHHGMERQGPGYASYYYPYYQHPQAPPYPIPFQPAAPLHYPSIYSHSYPHPHPQQQQQPPQQPFPVYPPFFNTPVTQPIYPYPQPLLHSENENIKQIPDEGIPIPSASTTTILVSASPNDTESGSVTSHTSSSSPKAKNLAEIFSSDSSTTATSFPSAEEESDSGNKLPPLSALPTLNNLPTLGTIPTPIEGRNELASGTQDSAIRHSPPNSTFTLNPANDPFVPSTLVTTLASHPIMDERRIPIQHDLDQDNDTFLQVRDLRCLNANSWASERVLPQMQSDEQREREMTYGRQQPVVHNDNDEVHLDDLRTHRDVEFQRGGFRPNARMMDDWRGGRGFRGRGFIRGRGRAGFRGRGYGFSHGFAPPVVPRDAYEISLGTPNGMNIPGGGTAPPRYRRGRGVGLFIPPNLDMQHLHHQNHHDTSPSQITPPYAFSTSPYASCPPTTHPSPLMSQANLHFTPPSQYHVPAQIPIQAPPLTWTAQHPWPTPLTPLANIPILLDEVRYRLLGQLEYYLSTENMAKDMWLRRKMSTEGWIPLSVIMTFNRIKQLTDDLNLVIEVLGFSEHVEVLDDGDPEGVKIRMRDEAWKRYLLPPPVVLKMAAPLDKTVVPVANGSLNGACPPPAPHVNGDITLPASNTLEPVPATVSDESEEDPDSEEDDVVFVMGSEGGGWSRAASGERGA